MKAVVDDKAASQRDGIQDLLLHSSSGRMDGMEVRSGKTDARTGKAPVPSRSLMFPPPRLAGSAIASFWANHDRHQEWIQRGLILLQGR